MFLMASSCRLLASIESGDRMLKQVKVRPMDDNQTKTQNIRHGNLSQASKCDDDYGPAVTESSLEMKKDRRDWAKVGESYKKRALLATRTARKKT